MRRYEKGASEVPRPEQEYIAGEQENRGGRRISTGIALFVLSIGWPLLIPILSMLGVPDTTLAGLAGIMVVAAQLMLLMGVAIASSCAFLTPIGHQNNTLIMGPGGYHFGDYWRLGLPLEILIALIGVPLIALVWPL